MSLGAVKELREKTGAGLLDCQKALGEAEGDVDKALRLLRERGIAKAAKKATRVATDGQVGAYIHPGGKIGASMLEKSELKPGPSSCYKRSAPSSRRSRRNASRVAPGRARRGLGLRLSWLR